MNDDVIHPLAKFIRLQNGDDIIAELIETEDEHGILYTVFHPLKVVYVPSEGSGYLSIAFMPWVFPRICEQQEFVLHAEDILLTADVTEKMNIYYWESVDHYINTSYPLKEEPEPEQPHEREISEELSEALSQYTKRTFH